MAQFKMEFIPMEDDLLSLEMNDVARDIWLVGQFDLLWMVVLIVLSEWRRHTVILLFVGVDDLSACVWAVPSHHGQRGCGEGTSLRNIRLLAELGPRQRLTSLLERHHSSGDPLYAGLEVSEQVDGLIVIDRSVDWVTPMCTQLTYEGMLDEFVGIKNGQ